MTGKNITRRRRWSLVRIFVSFVPEIVWKYLLPNSFRLNIQENMHLWNPKVKCDMCQTKTSPKSFNSFRSYINSNNKNSEINLSSTPKLDSTNNDSRISDIQKDLEQLKDQVAKILKQQQEKLLCLDNGSEINQLPNNSKIEKLSSEPSLKPKPPPPPPPLPSYLIAAKPPIIKIKTKEAKPKLLRPPVPGFIGGEELLRDLKKVQLKKIQKSPGGGPLKKQKQSPQDPGNFLEEALKKRFNYIQNISSDTSSETVIEMNDSFNSDVYNGRFYECKKVL